MHYGECLNVNVRNLSGHKDEVHAIAFSSDHQITITGSRDCRVRIYKTESNEFLTKLKGHEAPVNSVKMSSDSKLIISGDASGKVIVWRTRDASRMHQFCLGENNGVEVLKLSGNDDVIAIGTTSGFFVKYDLHQRREIFKEKIHKDKISSLDLTSAKEVVIATGSWDKTAKLIDDQSIHKIDKRTKGITCVCFAQFKPMLAVAARDKKIRLFHWKERHLLREFETDGGWVRAIDFTPCQTYLLAANDFTVTMWDIVHDRLVRSFETEIEGDTLFLEVSEEGKIMVAGTGLLLPPRYDNGTSDVVVPLEQEDDAARVVETRDLMEQLDDDAMSSHQSVSDWLDKINNG